MATTLDIRTEENRKYLVERFTYPENLLSAPEYSGNKVVFFINVNTDGVRSGHSKREDNPEFETFEIPKGDSKKYSGQRIAEIAESFAGTQLTAATMKRLNAAIALHMPNSITQGTSVDWSEEDFTTDNATKFLEAGGKILDLELRAAGRAAATGAIAQRLSRSLQLQRSVRITPGNTKAEMLFRKVNFRNFTFTYTFAPKSKAEAQKVLNIIRMFKHHMLPEFKDLSNFLYIYPSEFNVKYYKGDKENEYLAKQLTAVLTSVDVDYTPNGQFNTFADGMPQQINMQLSFQEIATPSKESSPYNAHGV